jgi:exonuclease VII small subunit
LPLNAAADEELTTELEEGTIELDEGAIELDDATTELLTATELDDTAGGTLED